MGNTFSMPRPDSESVSVSLIHLHHRHKSIDGYVEDNEFTLEYTLQAGHNTVAQLLSMTQQHGQPSGNGIVGFSRTAYEWNGFNPQESMIPLHEKIRDGERLYLVVV
jgi:hypothetical protein